MTIDIAWPGSSVRAAFSRLSSKCDFIEFSRVRFIVIGIADSDIQEDKGRGGGGGGIGRGGRGGRS